MGFGGGFKGGAGDLGSDLKINDGTIKIKEQANAETDTTAYGQIWVKSNAPCDLYFTDDTGQDIRITNDGSLAAAGSASSVKADDIEAGDAAVTLSTTTGNVTIDSNAGTAKLDGHTGVNIVSSNSGEIDITSAAAIDINATTGITADGTTVSIDGTDDSNFTVTASGKDLDLAVAGGGTQELRLTSAGTGAAAINIDTSAGGIDIDSADMITVDAADEITITTTSADGHISLVSAHTAGVALHIDANAHADSEVQIDAGVLDIDVTGDASLDSSAGSITIGAALADGQTLKLGKNGAVETIIAPHGTAGSEAYSVTNTAGTTDGAYGQGAMLLEATAGGMGLKWADGKDLWAEGGRAVITANEDAAECIKLHADAGTSQTIKIVNDEGTETGAEAEGAILIEAAAGGIGLHGADDKRIWAEAGQVIVTANENAADAIKLHADAGANQTITLLNDAGTGASAVGITSTAGGVTISGDTDHGVIVGNVSGGPVTIGHTTSETTVSDNLTVTGNSTLVGAMSGSSTLEVVGAVTSTGDISTSGSLSAGGDLTVTGADIVLGADSDGTDRTVTFGHSTLKTIMGIDDSADAFVINTDAAFDGTLANNSLSIDASHNMIVAGNITSGGSFVIGSADMNETDLEKLDGITNGTAAANKAVVLDGSKNIATLGTVGCGAITSTGASSYGSLAGGALSGSSTLEVVGASTLIGAVNVSGAISAQNTVTVGVDDTGYDVKFFGATSGQYMLWDESADELVLAGDSKLSFHDAAGDENIVASSDGHLEVNAGTTLDCTAPTIDLNASTALTVDGPSIVLANTATNTPVVQVLNTHNGATGGILRFVNDKGGAGADDDVCGTIQFYGDDDAQDNIEFASITAQVADASNGAEGGRLILKVATHDGEAQPGLTIVDGSAEDEVDVTIGNGTASVTTTAGVLKVVGNVIQASDGGSTITMDDDDNVTIAGKIVGPQEIEQASDGGGSCLLIDNDDTDQIALNIDAANIDGNVLQIAADAVTTAQGIQLSVDALTSGGGIFIESTSNNLNGGSIGHFKYNGTSTNNNSIVKITNDHTSATNTIPIEVDQDSTGPIMKVNYGANGSAIALSVKEVDITLSTSGTTTTTNSFIPAGAVVIGLGIRVITALDDGSSGGTSYISNVGIGAATGVTANKNYFGQASDNVLETQGQTAVLFPGNLADDGSSMYNVNAFGAATPLVITTAAQPSAGEVRVALYYYQVTPPQSN